MYNDVWGCAEILPKTRAQNLKNPNLRVDLPTSAQLPSSSRDRFALGALGVESGNVWLPTLHLRLSGCIAGNVVLTTELRTLIGHRKE